MAHALGAVEVGGLGWREEEGVFGVGGEVGPAAAAWGVGRCVWGHRTTYRHGRECVEEEPRIVSVWRIVLRVSAGWPVLEARARSRRKVPRSWDDMYGNGVLVVCPAPRIAAARHIAGDTMLRDPFS